MLRSAITLFAFLLLAAHGLRTGSIGVACFWLSGGLLLLAPWSWKHLAMAGLLAFGSVLWGKATLHLVELRLAHSLDWVRLAAILGTVTMVTAGAALWQFRQGWRNRDATRRPANIP